MRPFLQPRLPIIPLRSTGLHTTRITHLKSGLITELATTGTVNRETTTVAFYKVQMLGSAKVTVYTILALSLQQRQTRDWPCTMKEKS